MKLLRYGPRGRERPGLLDRAGRIRDLAAEIQDIVPATLAPERLASLKNLDPEGLPPVAGKPRLGPPIAGVGKVIGIGLNYADHAAEAGVPVPEEPILFMKATTAISGPTDPVVIPKDAEKTDWEVELGVVIGRSARYVAAEAALDHVAGYCIVNDVSERAFQLERGGQFVKGKSADGFAPMGPWLVTTDEIPDPQNLALWLEVNGKRYQDGHTSRMVFGVAELVSYISRFMTLAPGDVITTGTPPGVGMGQKPPVYLRPGDRVRLGIEGLGEQDQEMLAWSLAPIP
ncbi:MAG: fumarylacetoacetate hydrolase family protein [Alphaproteobacteria bacterium]